MSRYTGAKARVNRRLSTMLFENSGATRAFERRDSPPGMHTRRGRPTNYGTGLAEKQKIKYYYGLHERQLRRFYDAVAHKKGNTGELLLLMCERRLDNVVRRAGFARTRPQARQAVAHGHFNVNGHKVNTPSYVCRPGDVIEVRDSDKLKANYQLVLTENLTQPLDWITVDPANLSITVQGMPGPGDISLPVDGNLVVEFLSR